MVKVFCRNTGTYGEFPEGVTIREIESAFNLDNPLPILAAKVNFVVEGLKFRIFNNKDIEFLDYSSYAGRSVYCRSLCFLLAKASSDVCPSSRITMRRPISKGYFCEIAKADGTAVSKEEIDAIRERMKEIVGAGEEFHRHEVRTEEAIEIFSSLKTLL